MVMVGHYSCTYLGSLGYGIQIGSFPIASAISNKPRQVQGLNGLKCHFHVRFQTFSETLEISLGVSPSMSDVNVYQNFIFIVNDDVDK
jgi:hypothetical protein